MRDQNMKGKMRVGKDLFWTPAAVYRAAGISYTLGQMWVEASVIPAPTVVIGKRKYYTEKDARKHVATIMRVRQGRWDRKATSFAAAELAPMCGTSPQVFGYHLKMKNIPKPIGGGRYTVEEALKIKKYFEWRRRVKSNSFRYVEYLRLEGFTENQLDWASHNFDALTAGLHPIKLGNGRKDRWWTRQDCVQIARRLRFGLAERGLG
jgi:hypothetical protein